MAYMSQERKASLAPRIKNICKQYRVKASLGVNHHSTLVLKIKSSPIDFIRNYNEVCSQRAGWREFQPAKDYIQVNPYWFHEHFSLKAQSFLTDVIQAMNVGNHDNSDIQSDYFDVGWYISINIGSWDKPYSVE